jgi:hypothetical protein
MINKKKGGENMIAKEGTEGTPFVGGSGISGVFGD